MQLVTWRLTTKGFVGFYATEHRIPDNPAATASHAYIAAKRQGYPITEIVDAIAWLRKENG